MAATASVRGAAHERDGRPNQDAVRVVPVGGAAPGLVAAVCDGHGGARYVRSEVGSRMGVEVACAAGKRALDELGPNPSEGAIRATLTGRVAPAIIERWRERVLDDVQRRAFTDDERARAGAPLDHDPLISYGCTLLLAIVGPSWIGLLQIGDGDVTVVRGDRAESPVPDDDRLVGGETTSLCLPTAVADARVSVLVEPLPDLLLLTSDGYANSFASPTWRSDAGLDLRSHVDSAGLDQVEARLPAWLAESATAGGDDVSMALIRRVDTAAPSQFPTPVTGLDRSRPDTAGAGAGTMGSQRRSRGALVPLGIAAAALVGLGGGWAIGSAGDGSAPVDTATSVAPTFVVVSTVDSTTPAAPTTAPPPSLAVPTDAPTDAPQAVAPLDIEHQVLLLDGGETGYVVAVDLTDPASSAPVFVARVALPNRVPSLAANWSWQPGVLTFGTCSYVAAAAAATAGSPYVWSVDDGASMLTWYDPATGAALGAWPLSGDPVAPTPVAAEVCAPGTSPAVPVTSPPAQPADGLDQGPDPSGTPPDAVVDATTTTTTTTTTTIP